MDTALKYGTSATGSSAAKSVWIGRVLSGIAIAFFVMDGVMKLIQPQVVIDATQQIGWPVDATTLTVLGLILLASTALYAFPPSALRYSSYRRRQPPQVLSRYAFMWPQCSHSHSSSCPPNLV